MDLWNFFHDGLGGHVYNALSILVLILMAVFAVLFILRERKWTKENELSGNTAAEPAKEAEVNAK